MNRKFSLGVCVSLIAIACAVTFVLTMSISLNLYNAKIAGVGEREVIYTKLRDIDSYARSNYIGAIDEERLITGIMNGYMAGTGDVKAKYITASDYYEIQQAESGKIITAGVQAARDESGYIRISGVYEGSSAELQGIEPGDIITQIDGVQVLEIGAENAMKLLSGEKGTRVAMTTRRSGEERRYTLIRQEIEIITVKGVNYGDCGFIRISGFAENTGVQFDAVLNQILENDAKALIIDVRALNGCLVAPVRQILERLVSRNIVAVGEYKNGNVNNIIEINSDENIDLPVTVITDANTSEGGELLTAALKDFADARVVGTPTKGDCVFTATQTLRDGGAVMFSVMKVRSLGGTSFENDGIKPDFSVELTSQIENNLDNLENTLDAQIKKAFEITEPKIQ